MSEVRKQIVGIVNQAEAMEGGSFLALHAAIAASIRESGQYASVLVSNPLLAVQQLRVARRLYDEQNFPEALIRAKKAYENKIALSDDATIEALRIIGLVGIRIPDRESLDFSLTELGRRPERKAKKILNFLVGFDGRLSKRYPVAEAALKAAMKNGGDGDYHVLREMASTLIGLGRTTEAEQFARKALAIAYTNPYILDVLLACLIDKLRHVVSDRRLEDEISDLLANLVAADARERKSFAPQQQTAFAIARRDKESAKQLVRAAQGRKEPWVFMASAELSLLLGDGRGALEALEELRRSNRQKDDDETSEGNRHIGRVRALALAQSDRLDEAIKVFNDVKSQLGNAEADYVKRELLEILARSNVPKSVLVRSFVTA